MILCGVVVVAMGRGGELARERPDVPAPSDFRTWSDVGRYRPPAALLGYHPRTTEHALSLIARTIAERDAEIEWLRKRLAEARPEFGPYSSDAPYKPDEEDVGLVRDTHPTAGASSRLPDRRGRMTAGLPVLGPDGLLRCPWSLSSADYLRYHDEEWDDRSGTIPGCSSGCAWRRSSPVFHG